MKNIGRIITDDYCNGFADDQYDMKGAVIVAEGEGWIVARTLTGRGVFLDFQYFDKQHNEDGSLKEDWNVHKIRPYMQSSIDDWCDKQRAINDQTAFDNMVARFLNDELK